MVCHDRTEAIPHKLREISGFVILGLNATFYVVLRSWAVIESQREGMIPESCISTFSNLPMK